MTGFDSYSSRPDEQLWSMRARLMPLDELRQVERLCRLRSWLPIRYSSSVQVLPGPLEWRELRHIRRARVSAKRAERSLSERLE